MSGYRQAASCQEETQGGSDDERKGEKRMKVSDETRCEVRYKRVSTDLYRWGEPDQDMYVRKRECISNTSFTIYLKIC